MLGKVMKYDIKFGKAAFLIMAGAMIFGGLFIRILNTPFARYLRDSGVMVILPLALMGVFTAGIVLVFQNFNRNLFGTEGYLILTLPVKRHKLMVSKLLTTVMWYNIMSLAALIMALLISPQEWTNLMNLTGFGFLNMTIGWLTTNLGIVNMTLFLYMMSATAHISAGGRRPGWALGSVVLVGAIVLESLFGSKVLARLLPNAILWIVQAEAGGPWSFHLTQNLFDLYEDVNRAFSVDFVMLFTMVLFSAIAWLVTLHCLKKRVDLP